MNPAELLENYFTALSNFYNIISLDEAYQIITMQNPQLKLTPASLMDFADQHCEDQAGHYYIERVPEYFADTDNDGPLFLQDESMGVADGFFDLYPYQEGSSYYVPAKRVLLQYVDEEYIPPTTEFKDVYRFLSDQVGLKGERLADTYHEIYLNLFCETESETDEMVDSTIADLERMQIPMDFDQEDDLAELLFALEPTMRVPRRRGYTAKEWERQSHVLDPFSLVNGVSKKFNRLAKRGAIDINELKKYVRFNIEYSSDPIINAQQVEKVVKELDRFKMNHF